MRQRSKLPKAGSSLLIRRPPGDFSKKGDDGGSADSNNLVVVDTLDPGLVFVGASDGGVYDGAART